MVRLKRIVLDVLKPHHPTSLEFAQTIAGVGTDYGVYLTVTAVDERTETLQIEVTGGAIDFEKVEAAISSMGGSLHSIDEVEVHSAADDD